MVVLLMFIIILGIYSNNIYIWYIRNKIIGYIVYIMKNPAR